MGNHHLPLPAYLILLLAAPARAADAPSGAVPDVVIQAEDRRPVTRAKPAIDLPLKLDQPLKEDVDGDDGVLARLPSDLSKTTAFVPGLSQPTHAKNGAQPRVATAPASPVTTAAPRAPHSRNPEPIS